MQACRLRRACSLASSRATGPAPLGSKPDSPCSWRSKRELFFYNNVATPVCH